MQDALSSGKSDKKKGKEEAKDLINLSNINLFNSDTQVNVLLSLPLSVEAIKARKAVTALAFLDSGAQRNFISTPLISKLHLAPKKQEGMTIIGFNKIASRIDAKLYEIAMISRRGERTTIECIEMKQIVGALLTIDANTKDKKRSYISSRYFSYQKPDLLIGVSDFTKMFPRVIRTLPSGFSQWRTDYGDCVAGNGMANGYIKPATEEDLCGTRIRAIIISPAWQVRNALGKQADNSSINDMQFDLNNENNSQVLAWN